MLNILKKNFLVFFLLINSYIYICMPSDMARAHLLTITTEFPKNKEELSKNAEVKQTLDTGTSKYPISYKLRKSKDGWKIVNIIINGVNLGLTFRNQFQALAVSHNENISDTLRNWVSDAGTAGIT